VDEVLYFYIALMALFTLRILFRMRRREELPSGRIRNSLVIASFAAGLGFAILRGAAFWIEFLVPMRMLGAPGLTWSNALIAFAIVGLAASFAPNALFRIVARRVLYLQQLLALRDLEG
jgi:hypothetical protein